MEDPKELEKIRDRESDITKERIQKVPILALLPMATDPSCRALEPRQHALLGQPL